MDVTRLRAILRQHGAGGVLYVALVLSLRHFWTKRRVPFLASLFAVTAATVALLWSRPALHKTLPSVPTIVPLFQLSTPPVKQVEQEIHEEREKVSEPMSRGGSC
jgi:hypothetical protein